MPFESNQYYHEVGSYYDEDATEFERRYWKNPVLQRIRNDFRTYVHQNKMENVLEIGFGSGIDLAHFAQTHPECSWSGIDISEGMVQLAQEKKLRFSLNNLSVAQGSVEHIKDCFPGQKFDLIYVFFGALNTVENLEKAAEELDSVLTKDGKLVLTFVNKWYLGGMAIELLKLRWSAAFARLKKVWGGYSPNRHLSSVCYSPKQIGTAFKNFVNLDRQGYSILHPAWYYIRFNVLLGSRGRWWLWKVDKLLNGSPAWKWGEYTLFVMKRVGQ